MSYAYKLLAESVVALLEQRPALTLEEISARLGVHRHTLHAALAACGGDFAGLKRKIVLRRLQQAFAAAVPIKTVWAAGGFSSACTFARYVRRATGKSPRQLREAFISGRSDPKLAEVGLDLQGGVEKTELGLAWFSLAWRHPWRVGMNLEKKLLSGAWALAVAAALFCFAFPPTLAEAQSGACCNIPCSVSGSNGQCYFVNNFGDCWCLPGQGNLTEGCRPPVE